MKPVKTSFVKSTSEIQKFYTQKYFMLNEYIKRWLGTPLKMKFSDKEISIDLDVLLNLFKLFNLSGTHTEGGLWITFDPSYPGRVRSQFLEESFRSQIAKKYNLESIFGIYTDDSDRILNDKYDMSKDLIDMMYSKEFQNWRKPELSSIPEMIETIHQSFLELTDNKMILRSHISQGQADPDDPYDPNSGNNYLSVLWRLILIPNSSLVNNNKSLLSEFTFLQLSITIYSQ